MEQSPDGIAKPNAIFDTNSMEAWNMSKQPNALTRVEEIMESMIERSEVLLSRLSNLVPSR